MKTNLKPDSNGGAQYLYWINPNAPAYLEHMASEGPSHPRSQTFNSCATTDLAAFIEKHNGNQRRNIYHVPNAEFLDGKRNKANISAVRFLHVDLDFKDYPGKPAEQVDRVKAFLFDSDNRPSWIPHPTSIWMTGGGYQAIWRLEEPIGPDTAEKLNMALLKGLEGGPGTHDVSRLLRIPSTVNWLNDKKRKDGREPAIGHLAYPTTFKAPPSSYKVDDFVPPDHLLSSGGDAKSPKVANVTSIAPLPLPEKADDVLPDDTEWRAAIRDGKTPKGKSYSSRSELMFAATVWMLSNGMQPGTVLAVLLAPRFAIGDHIRDRAGDIIEQQSYAERQVKRALGVVSAKGSEWPTPTDNGQPKSNDPNNIRHALSKLGVAVRRNEFTAEDEFEGFRLEDRDINDIADILSSKFVRHLHFSASSAAIKRELLATAHEYRYHPVRECLDGLVWDGVKRLDTWLSDYAGVENTELHRAFAAKTLIGAVRRIRKPGSKFDTMLVLEGDQGVGKSRLVRKLALRDAWFCESLNLKAGDRERAQILARAWIAECQELDGLNKMTHENLKKFLSESTDTYRKPYDKNARQYPRHSILIGTTNEFDYLRDLTGNRRFWPVKVKQIDVKGFAGVVEQLWAEAAHREAVGESATLPKHLWNAAADAQAERVAEDPYMDALSGTLGGMVAKVSMDSIKLILGLPTAKLTPHDSRRIKAVMETLDWRDGTFRLWVSARGERRPVRGFMANDADESSPEVAARQTKDGKLTVALVGKNGELISPTDEPQTDDQVPF
ncbi:VapE domain-containing protein [Boseongicola aestuarii]|uniref:Virulence-associated protein E n=1 Tax=Boseongicola aestuarii TaxID=1470561 RepID=A0A238J4E8_9RHOB|nr:VapE domain-containing protein [Boseongicola aestuarii]SMX25035.1 Virulence-associated protein E [Boseongicola aestuarii]